MRGLTGVDHVAFIVADVQRSLTFYHRFLQLESNPMRPDLGYPGAWLDVGGQQLHLLQLDNPDPVFERPEHVGRDRHAAFTIPDIDPVMVKLETAGVAYTRSRSGRRALFFRDPDGNGIELIEVSAGSPQ